jgi:Bacterial Ig domain
MGGGGTALATANVGLDRPDVGAALANPYWPASGFSAEVAGQAVQPGLTTLYVYGHTPARGWWYQPTYVSASSLVLPGAPLPAANGFPSVTISAPTSGEHIRWTQGRYTLQGAAADPRAGRANGSGIDRVSVYFYGDEHDPNRIFIGNATLNGTTWSLTFTPKNVPTGHPQMYVYAHSALTGRESSASVSLYLEQNA